jgi:hypothetical protein
MTQSHSSPHTSATGPELFPAGEWETLQAADREAARNIVCLMGGVFCIGLMGYLVIAYIVSQSGWTL